jgi:hypothetical protein
MCLIVHDCSICVLDHVVFQPDPDAPVLDRVGGIIEEAPDRLKELIYFAKA